jgi:hypothetical protein
MSEKQQEIVERVRSLSPEKIEEVLDFISLIEQRESKRAWIEFDEWALNLAKEKGFDRLTEEDVTEIVKQHRIGN